MIAGTRTERMITASIKTAEARPRPNSLMIRFFAEHEGGEDGDHDRRGRGDHPAGQRQAAGDGGSRPSWLCSHSSWIRDIRKTS